MSPEEFKEHVKPGNVLLIRYNNTRCGDMEPKELQILLVTQEGVKIKMEPKDPIWTTHRDMREAFKLVENITEYINPKKACTDNVDTVSIKANDPQVEEKVFMEIVDGQPTIFIPTQLISVYPTLVSHHVYSEVGAIGTLDIQETTTMGTVIRDFKFTYRPKEDNGTYNMHGDKPVTFRYKSEKGYKPYGYPTNVATIKG